MRTRTRGKAADDRRASAPPANPGYGTEDQDHPAHTQDDPAYEAYKQGDPSAWAEDVHQPPYLQANPPADPGYDTEDQDHPAHEQQPQVPKEARSLRAAVEKKADKCIALARHMLGPKAKESAIEDQALDLMDMPESQLNATLERLGGGFLSMDDDFIEEVDEPEVDMLGQDDDLDMLGQDDDLDMLGQDDDLDELLACGEPMACGDAPMSQDEMVEIDEMDEVMALRYMAKVKKHLAQIRAADQNDPKDDTLTPDPKSEEAEKAEAKDTAKGEEKSASTHMAALFDTYDTDGDGFVTSEDWKGSKRAFTSLDLDKDGILARHEVLSMFEDDFVDDDLMLEDEILEDEILDDDLYDLPPEEMVMLAEMKAEAKCEGLDDNPGLQKECLKKVEEGKKNDAEEPKKEAAEEDEEVEVEVEDEGEDEAAKEAAVFGLGGDPMGLSDVDILTDEDALLREVFGSKAAEDEEAEDEEVASKKAAKKKAKKAEDDEAEDDEEEADEAEEEVEEEAEEAEEEADEVEEEADEKKGGKKKKAAQRPQPRKPNPGPRTVGNMTRQASSEIKQLSDLWAKDPDVSEVFGVPSPAK